MLNNREFVVIFVVFGLIAILVYPNLILYFMVNNSYNVISEFNPIRLKIVNFL